MVALANGHTCLSPTTNCGPGQLPQGTVVPDYLRFHLSPFTLTATSFLAPNHGSSYAGKYAQDCAPTEMRLESYLVVLAGISRLKS